MAYFTQQELSAVKNDVARPKTATVKPKQTGRGGYLTSLISEGGGTAGALGGAALGTAILPGVGTLIGAGLGGFLGGTTGRLAENKIRDNEYRVGDALKEGAISGVAGAGPLRLLKGAGGAVKGASKAIKPAEDVFEKVAAKPIATVRNTSSAEASAANREGRLANPLNKTDVSANNPLQESLVPGTTATRSQNALQGAQDAINKPGILNKFTGGNKSENLKTQGQQMQGRGIGISGGNKVNGKELTPQDTERMLQTLNTEGIKTGNANIASRDLNNKLKTYGQQISEHFKANNAPLQAADTKVIADNFLAGIKTTDPAIQKQYQIIADDLQKNVKSTKDLWEFRKSLDARIPDTKFADEATTAKVSALKDARQYITKELGDVPGAKNYHDLAEIKPFVGKGMRELNQPSGGILDRVLSSGVAQKAENLAGKGVEAAGNVGGTVSAAGIPNKLGVLGRITAGNALLDPSMPVDTQSDLTQQEELPPENIGGQAQAITADDVLAAQQGTGDDTDPYSPANIAATVKSIIAQGGTQKDVAEFLSNAKVINDLNATKAEKPLSAEASKIVSNAQTGLQALDDYEAALAADPSVAAKRVIPGRGVLGGLVGGALGTSSADAAANQIVDVIARLRTGAAITDSEAKRFETFIPQAFDNAETRAQKINYLKNQFQAVANRTGSAGTDTQSALGL